MPAFIAAPTVLGEPQMLWGQPNARIHNLALGGTPVTTADFFKTKKFVEGLIFSTIRNSKP